MHRNLLIILVVAVVIGYSWYTKAPHLSWIENNEELAYQIEEIPNKDNYSDLVNQSLSNGSSFLLESTAFSKVFYHNNAFKNKTLNKEDTYKILEILNDTSSYIWGESTPEYEFAIVYFNEQNKKIGFTKFDRIGYFQSYPFRSLMKWGTVKESVSKRILDIVE